MYSRLTCGSLQTSSNIYHCKGPAAKVSPPSKNLPPNLNLSLFFFQTHPQNQSALVLGIKTPLRSSLSSRNPLQKNLFLSLCLSAVVSPSSLASPAFFFSGFFLSIFPGKPSPASLFQQSAAWLLLQLVPRMERGPPHTPRVLPASLIYIKKLNTLWLFKKGSTHMSH